LDYLQDDVGVSYVELAVLGLLVGDRFEVLLEKRAIGFDSGAIDRLASILQIWSPSAWPAPSKVDMTTMEMGLRLENSEVEGVACEERESEGGKAVWRKGSWKKGKGREGREGQSPGNKREERDVSRG